MSDNLTHQQQRNEMDHKLLYAIIRKPQEGKTFICLENIKRNSNSLHIIMTMNTIKSNKQFFHRANQEFPNRLCVFNSKATKEETRQFTHCKELHNVFKAIQNKKDIIVMCCHKKRFNDSVLDLIVSLTHDNRFNKNIFIHIDEAHAYIPRYRNKIYEINQHDIIETIYLYSATPFNMWLSNDSNLDDQDKIYQNIFVVDIEADFGIKKSEKYFGVKDCNHYLPDSKPKPVSNIISDYLIDTFGDSKQKESNQPRTWYGEDTIFSLGNEIKYLSYIQYILSNIKNKHIFDNKFSYNFIPAYQRKLTHYAVMYNVLEQFPSAVVIVINGDGTTGYVKDTNNIIMSYILPDHNEPSKQIESFIQDYPNRPVFVTGFTCVGMSVTLINESIGNFDNVIFSHEHYINRPEILYQLCRFLFNYIAWDNPTNRKKTNLFSETKETIRCCLKYEKQIDKIDREMSGSIRTQDEIRGNIPIKKGKLPKEKTYDQLKPFVVTPIPKPKCFPVNDPEDEDLNKQLAIDCYTKWMGNPPKSKSIPKKNKDGKYMCSITAKCEVQYGQEEIRKKMKNWKWHNNYQLVPNQFKYARIYVVYDKDDPSEYTWIVRRMEIQDTPECRAVMKTIIKKN